MKTRVVRCGQCEHWKCNPNTNEYGVCNKVSYDEFEVVMHSDDFCSYGIKKSMTIETLSAEAVQRKEHE